MALLSLCTAGALALVEPTVLAMRPAVAPACGAPPASAVGRRALLSGAAAAALGALPAATHAEATLVTRQQSYTRYVPRIERGRDFWATKLRKDIANQDWKSIEAALEPVTKKGGGSISLVIGPMGLWASSFSSKVISDKTLAMNAAVDELTEAAETLAIAAAGKEKDTGIFGVFGGQKQLDDTARSALAKAAYKKGTRAFNKYIEIGNDGLGLNFAPLDTID